MGHCCRAGIRAATLLEPELPVHLLPLSQCCVPLQVIFDVSEINSVIKDSLDAVLLNCQYNDRKVPQWTSSCIEQCVKRLGELQKPYKYIVTCMIMQKNGAGMHTSCSCYWDNYVDTTHTLKWENKSMYCLCSVFGLAL